MHGLLENWRSRLDLGAIYIHIIDTKYFFRSTSIELYSFIYRVWWGWVLYSFQIFFFSDNTKQACVCLIVPTWQLIGLSFTVVGNKKPKKKKRFVAYLQSTMYSRLINSQIYEHACEEKSTCSPGLHWLIAVAVPTINCCAAGRPQLCRDQDVCVCVCVEWSRDDLPACY